MYLRDKVMFYRSTRAGNAAIKLLGCGKGLYYGAEDAGICNSDFKPNHTCLSHRIHFLLGSHSHLFIVGGESTVGWYCFLSCSTLLHTHHG